MVLLAKGKKSKKLSLARACLVVEDPRGALPERPSCQECGLFKGAKTPFMGAQVPEDWTGRLLIVGERPGQDEDKKSGHPFSGKSGVMLRGWVAEKGFNKSDVAFTNATRCGGPDNATPSMTQIRCCRPFLLWEIGNLKPETVLAVGTSALRAVTNDGQATVTRMRGRLLEVPCDAKTQP